MARGRVALAVTPADRMELERLVRSGKTQQRVAFRSRIVLKAAEGLPNKTIADTLGTSRPTVIAWRRRYEAQGMAGLLRDRPRGKAFAALPKDKEEAVVEKTLQETPPAATHWSCRTMASAMGLSKNSVQRIWHAHGLKPHLVKTFKLSNDPQFVEKLQDVVGLYLNPPDHALVLSLDEKSQIQALDRTQPGLPMKKGRCGTMTHDYKRNGTTTLFAALDVLKGEVIGRCMPRHRHQEFLKFLKIIDRTTPPSLALHCIVDNYATHKKQEVHDWLAHHPRFHFHFIPTSSSWLNLVERWFASITNQRIRRGSFSSVAELEAAIQEYIEHNNQNPQPFVWTKSASHIIQKVNRGKALLGTLH
ncbi:MAG: IS630 family transposase [Lysobacterales bacterium]